LAAAGISRRIHPGYDLLDFHHILHIYSKSRTMSGAVKGSNYDEKVSDPAAYDRHGDAVDGEVVENVDHLHRRLGNRQIQLMAIGGSIGTVCSECCLSS
jgi:amino acid permease